MVYLCTITASNSASINNASPTSGTCPINSTYTSYKLVFQNLLPATNERIMELQVHSGGSYRATNYNYIMFVNANSANGTVNGNAQTYFALTQPSASTNQSMGNIAPGYSGTITLTNSSANAIMNIDGEFGYWGGGGAGWVVSGTVFGAWGTAGVVDGFQVLMDSGNLTSGSILVYGIN